MTPPGGAVQQLTIRLPKNLYEQLRKTAFDQRRPMNEIIIEAVADKLDRPRQD
jgi:predicted transcriptional regulator